MKRKPIINIYGYIYCVVCSVNNKKYLGQHHWTKPELDVNYYGSGKIITQAIKLYGRSNFYIIILDWAESFDELNELEKFYIAKYDAVNNPEFYNLADGGQNLSSEEIKRFITDNTRKIWSDNLKERWKPGGDLYETDKTGVNNSFFGHHHTEEYKRKASILRRGKPIHSREQRQKWSEERKGVMNPNYGNYWNEAQRKSMSERLTGKYTGELNPNYGNQWSEEQRASHYKARPVIQLTKSGEYIQEFPYILKAARAVGVSESCIRDCCSGKQNTSAGFKWVYKEDYNNGTQERK